MPDRFATGTLSGAPALRTLRPSEALDEALRTYRILAPVLLRRSAVPAVFVMASVLFWTRAFGPRLFTTNSPSNVSAQVAETGFVLLVGLLVATPLLVFGMAEATLQATALVVPFREGRGNDEAVAAANARRAFPRTLGAGLWTFVLAGAIPMASFGLMAAGGLLTESSRNDDGLSGLFALFGVLGMIVGFFVALWVVAAHALVPAATLRGASVFEACRQSRRLMKASERIPGGYGAVWTVFSVLLVAALAEGAGISLALQNLPLQILPGGGLFGTVVSLAVPFLVAWTLLPFWGAAVAVIDAERRVRKEGYDVELLQRG